MTVRRGHGHGRIAFAVATLTACVRPTSVDGEPEVAPGPSTRAPASAPAPDETPTPGAAPRARQDVVTVVTDPAALAALEAEGLAIGPLVFGGGTPQIGSFVDDPGYASIRRTIAADIARLYAGDASAGVGLAYRHRTFDPAWLTAAQTRFELIAVVNRIDRRAFDESTQRCGETRLIFRLAYRTELDATEVDSRLPMTVNVVFWQPGECRDAAMRWLVDEGITGTALAGALRDGPLASSRLTAKDLKSVEVDVQTIRWPGVIHPSLGGHAEYALRVFRRAPEVFEGAFAPTPLENTPDVSRLRGDGPGRAALVAWVRDNLDGLDTGTAVMPEEFATDLATSVTPRGLARLANRPWSQLVSAKDFADLSLADYAHIGSPQALVRRLDELSCQGCHETRSVAGFHVVGQPRDDEAVLDTLAVSISAHLRGELPRREAYTTALASGSDVDEMRPLADFETTRGYGAHCGLGDPGFAAWTCADELRCTELDDSLVGTCLPPDRTAGDPCELGELRTRTEGHRDRVRGASQTACDAGAVCNVNRMGFPTGMCTKRCGGLSEGEACGPIVDFTTFNNCVGRRQPFPKCIEAAAHPVGLRACDEAHRCRDDYVCAKSAYGDEGVCLPPYFLFQLRVDGHVM